MGIVYDIIDSTGNGVIGRTSDPRMVAWFATVGYSSRIR